MKHLLLWAFVLMLAFVLFGCGESSSEAPPANSAHAVSWLATHGEAVLASTFSDCAGCHGNSLQGIGDAVSCYSCHAYNSDTQFTIHPPTWETAFTSHRGSEDSSNCAKCHGADLQGSIAAPGCFSASFDGRGCHASGPGQAPHPLDGSFLDGSNHGPIAKADLIVCQGCHGEPGFQGSNPRFNQGISGSGCEACHGINLAHPANWGRLSSATFHSSASNMENACTLCHGVNLDGVEGVGVSCLDCHNQNPLN